MGRIIGLQYMVFNLISHLKGKNYDLLELENLERAKKIATLGMYLKNVVCQA